MFIECIDLIQKNELDPTGNKVKYEIEKNESLYLNTHHDLVFIYMYISQLNIHAVNIQ